MKKNRITSVLQLYSILINTPLAIINLILLLIARGQTHDKMVLLLLSAIIINVSTIFLSVVANIIFSIIGKRRVVIGRGNIIYMNHMYIITEESRLIYSKISLDTFLTFAQPGELVLIINNKQVKLGGYFRLEITKMKRYLSIKEESKVIK